MTFTCQKYILLQAVVFILFVSQSRAQLSGSYTIDASAAASSSNYQDFASAVSDIVNGSRADGGTANGKGMSGPVIFTVANGNYYGQISFPAGINATKNAGQFYGILFESASGDSSKVILDDTLSHSFNSTTDYLLNINGATHIAFKGISFKRSKGGRLVLMNKNASHITFSDNVFYTATRFSDLVSDDYSYGAYNTFYNNLFENSHNGINLSGESGKLDTGYVIVHNTFINVNNAINARLHDSLTVTANHVSGAADSVATAISIFNSRGPITVKNNMINLHGSLLLNGVLANFNTGDAAKPILIADNMVSLHNADKSGTMAGISIWGNAYAYLVYNSVFLDSAANSSSYPLYITNSFSGHTRVMNNALVNNTGAYAVSFSDKMNHSDSFDYNDYYSAGSYPYYWDSKDYSLAGFRSSTAYDNHSIQVNPDFESASDLHVTGYQLNAKGFPFAGVTDDIDGDPRDTITPDIGADEILILNDLAVTALNSPPVRVCTGLTYPLKAVIRNAGTKAQNGFHVLADLSGPSTRHWSFTRTQILAAGAKDTIAWPDGISLTDTGTFTLTIYHDLAGDQDRTDDTLTYTFRAVSAAKPSFTASRACVNIPVSFHNTTADTQAAYTWSFGDGNSSALRNPTHSYGRDTAYKVVLRITDATGCTDTVSAMVQPLPVTYTTFQYQISGGGKVSFVPDDTTYKKYTWNFGDNGYDTSKTPEHTYRWPKIYSVTLTVINTNGCPDSITELVKITDAAMPQAERQALSIKASPNPFLSETTIEYQLQTGGNMQLDLYNAAGMPVLQQLTPYQQAGPHTLMINARKLSLHPGIYYLKCTTKNQVAIERLVVVGGE